MYEYMNGDSSGSSLISCIHGCNLQFHSMIPHSYIFGGVDTDFLILGHGESPIVLHKLSGGRGYCKDDRWVRI